MVCSVGKNMQVLFVSGYSSELQTIQILYMYIHVHGTGVKLQTDKLYE